MDNSKYLKQIIIDKYSAGELIEKEDVVIDESRINIYLNGEKTISMMCIPKNQEAHAVGFLMSENVISDVKDIKSIDIKEDGLEVRITADVDENMLQNLYKEKNSYIWLWWGGSNWKYRRQCRSPF